MHFSQRRLVIAAVGAALTLALLSPFGGASAGAKHRESKRGSCDVGKLCLYSKPEGGGKQLNLTKLGVSNKIAKKMNNDASSAVNGRDGAVFLYDKKGGNGDQICLEPLSKQNLSDFLFDNEASSSKLTKKDHCPV